MTVITKNVNKLNSKLIKEHLGNVRYNLQETGSVLNEAAIKEQVEYVLSSPSLRRQYFVEYKNQKL